MMILRTLAIVCALAVSARAAVTVTARGTSGNNTGATTLAITPGSNLAAGSMGVLVVACDNAGNGTTIHPTSFTDSVGNTWTQRLNALYDPVGANAGVDVGFYTAHLSVAVTTSNNITITWAGGNSVTAKAYALWEVTPTSASFVLSYITGAAGTGAASASPTVTTGSITSGDVVIAGGGAESASTWSGDADSTNGSWSTQQTAAGGTGNTGMSVTSQYKVVTGTATQQYDPTLTSADQIIGWIQLREVAANTSAFFQLF
jgi:hypothetical protein